MMRKYLNDFSGKIICQCPLEELCIFFCYVHDVPRRGWLDWIRAVYPLPLYLLQLLTFQLIICTVILNKIPNLFHLVPMYIVVNIGRKQFVLAFDSYNMEIKR